MGSETNGGGSFSAGTGMNAGKTVSMRRVRFFLACVTFLSLSLIYTLARESLCPFHADPGRARWRLAGDEPTYLLTAQAIASGHGEDVSSVIADRTYTNLFLPFWSINSPGAFTYGSYTRISCVRFRFDRSESWGKKQICHGGFLEPLLCAPLALSQNRPRWKILLLHGLLAALAGSIFVAFAPGGRKTAFLQAAATISILGSAPIVFYTAQIYPETIMGILLAAFIILAGNAKTSLRIAGHVCLFVSLFGSSRIAGAAFAAEAICLIRAIRERHWDEVAAIILGVVAYLSYHIWRWGNFFPPNTDEKSPITPSLLPRGVLRYLFGNSCGMIPLSPVSWAGLMALIPLWMRRRSERLALPCIVLSLGIALSVAMFPAFRAGRCAAGRYQVACIWTLLPAVLVCLGKLDPSSKWFRRLRSAILLLGPVSLVLAGWLATCPRSWHEYYHPFFKPRNLQHFYVLLPDFSGRWHVQLAVMLLILSIVTFLPDIIAFSRRIWQRVPYFQRASQN